MTKWPDLTILIVTYDRPIEIRKTIRALEKHIVYDGDIIWHLADDGTPIPSYLPNIRSDFPDLNITATKTDRRGWGANVNKAINHIKTDCFFLCEDDYVARKRINLNVGVALLDHNKTIGLVRYDGIAGHTGLNLWIREELGTRKGRLDYIEIDRKLSKHLNVYSNRPHLRHRRLHDKVGLYVEGRKLGATESEYAHRIKRKKECPRIAVFPDYIRRAFDHIGKTRQLTKDDV